MKGRNFSTLYGKFNIGEPVTVYARRGILQANRLAKVIHMPVTKRAVEIREALTVIAYGANQLDKKGRTEWGVKGGEYCAYLKGRHMTAKFPHYMKPHEKLPSDWQKYYLFSNLIAASSGFSWPRQKAPLTGGPPPAPYDLTARYDEEQRKIIGAVMLHPLQIYDVDFAVRIFLAGQYIENINPSIHKIIQLGPGPSPVQSEPVIIPFEFDSIRVAGIRFNMDYLRFDEMAWGSIYIYADCVTAYSHEHGPIPSVYSNAEEVMLPRRAVRIRKGVAIGKLGKISFLPGKELSKKGLKLFHRLRRGRRKHNKRYKAKVIQVMTKW